MNVCENLQCSRGRDIEFFSFSPSLLLFLHIKLKTEITFGTIEQHSKGLVTWRPRRKADNGQKNVMERKSNSTIYDVKGGKESPRICVKFIFASHRRKSNATIIFLYRG